MSRVRDVGALNTRNTIAGLTHGYDDVFYIIESCNGCGLWWDGWTGAWFDDVEYWQETDGKKPWEAPDAR